MEVTGIGTASQVSQTRLCTNSTPTIVVSEVVVNYRNLTIMCLVIAWAVEDGDLDSSKL